jgi:hypothetical protein
MRIERLDDGALRFVKPSGNHIDSVLPGCTQPMGNWQCLPVGAETFRYRGDRMDLGLAVDVLVQLAKRVPAGTRVT